jgi:uncharacterized protein with HEPN domain
LRDFQVYVEDIIDAINSIEEYTRDLTYEGFVKDKRTVDAVVRNFEIVGEATKHIPERVRKEYTSVPWRDMAGMRDRLIHGYFGVNLDVVWKTIKERLPIVKPLVEEALAEMKKKKLNKRNSQTKFNSESFSA